MKKKYIWAGVGTALLLAVLALALWLFPLIRMAFLLHHISETGGFQYEIAIDLEEENLSKQQRQVIPVLAWALTGQEDSGMSWEINGRVSEGLMYGAVFCKGSSQPVTELYFGQEEGLINVEMLYDSLRDNLIRQHPLVGGALPEWGYGSFLSSGQAEELFQIDLKELFQAKDLTENQTYSAREIFGILMGMKRQKGPDGETQFAAEIGDYQITLELSKKDKTPSLKILGSDETQSKEVSAYTGTFLFQKPEQILLPDSRMDDKDIRQFAKLWEAIAGLWDMVH